MGVRWTENEFFSSLTPAEARVAGAVAEGLSTDGVRTILRLGPFANINGSLDRIYHKLGLSNRADINPRTRLAYLVTWAEFDPRAKLKG